jgi:hypothetical protein
MREYDLSDAVTSLSHYSSATGTLWGIFAVATFTAAGFGISMGERFTFLIALFLTIGFAAFAVGHAYFIIHHLKVQRTISKDILRHLTETKMPTDFAESIKAVCAPENKLLVSLTTHGVIDACVFIIIWSTVRL